MSTPLLYRVGNKMTLEHATRVLGADTAAGLLKEKERGDVEISFFLRGIPASADYDSIAKLYCAALVTLTQGWCPPIGVPLEGKIFFTVQKHPEDYKKMLADVLKMCS